MKDEAIKKLLEYIEGSKDFLLEQVPEVFKEILTYDFFQNVYFLLVCFSIFVISATCFYIMINREQPCFEYKIFAGFIAAISLILTIATIPELIKIKTAPKYYLIQKILQLGNEK